MTITDSFREQVEAYLAESGMTATDFSFLAARDAGFVLGLRRGRDCRLSTADKVIRWMRDNPPHTQRGRR